MIQAKRLFVHVQCSSILSAISYIELIADGGIQEQSPLGVLMANCIPDIP